MAFIPYIRYLSSLIPDYNEYRNKIMTIVRFDQIYRLAASYTTTTINSVGEKLYSTVQSSGFDKLYSNKDVFQMELTVKYFLD